MIDAHAAMPALNITGDGELMAVIGTSTCQILNSESGRTVEGICGYVKDGVVPGLYTYEAGQPSVGDVFDWFVKNSVPASYEKEALAKGISIQALLTEKAEALSVGESGLIALDWFNGNRSVLVDPLLGGAILGMTLTTRPEHIYRALIESTAFGFRRIVEQYEKSGIKVKSIVAAGGIPKKNRLMMQIYSDVLKRDIRISGSSQAGALGSAAYAAVAAGIYPDVRTASKVLSKPELKVYYPIKENSAAYDRLYSEYNALHDYFGKENLMMHRLKGQQ
jgi:L-ribulokinase